MNKSSLLLIIATIIHGILPHKTPPMGWSSWNTFSDEITQDKVIGIADAIKSLKLDQFGYLYLTVDDLWNLPDRDQETHQMQVNQERFPQGMKYLGDYLHSQGLKFGIYSDAGTKTCAGMAGSLNHEDLDLKQFMEWGIDYLKYDNCYPNPNKQNEVHVMDIDKSVTHIPSFYQDPDEETRFSKMGDVILKFREEKNITFELCLYGWGNVEKWASKFGDVLWRTSGDISDRWPSVLTNIDRNDENRFVANQGSSKGWNYPDALFVGKGGMTNTENGTMFALWCAVKSPLMLGSDLRNMSIEDISYKIITNTELLKVNQDPLGIQATCRKNCCSKGTFGGLYPAVTCPGFQNSWQIWSGPLEYNDFVVVVVNRYDHEVHIEFNWELDAKVPSGIYKLRDLWSHQDIGIIDTSENKLFEGDLDYHDNWSFRLIYYEKYESEPTISVI